MSGYVLIVCTCPDAESARRIAGELVESRLAACVNLLPGVTSIYRWQDKMEEKNEHLLLIKSHQQLFHSIQDAINELHPYETPEVLSIKIDNGLPAYLSWLEDSLDPAEG
jgi:periplasmic divalent cation tolerance protein